MELHNRLDQRNSGRAGTALEAEPKIRRSSYIFDVRHLIQHFNSREKTK
jgi:hypothetical protein